MKNLPEFLPFFDFDFFQNLKQIKNITLDKEELFFWKEKKNSFQVKWIKLFWGLLIFQSLKKQSLIVSL